MATDKQRAANQRNAQKSTGPKTMDGKRNSSRNAMKHGFTARVHVLDCEDRGAYQELLNQYVELYPPATPAELEIVEQLTHSQWSLRRARIMHDGLLDDFYADAVQSDETTEEYGGDIDGSSDDHTRRLGYAFRRGSKALTGYARYSAHFSAQWWRCYRKLEKLHPSGRPELASFLQHTPKPQDTAPATPRRSARLAALLVFLLLALARPADANPRHDAPMVTAMTSTTPAQHGLAFNEISSAPWRCARLKSAAR